MLPHKRNKYITYCIILSSVIILFAYIRLFYTLHDDHVRQPFVYEAFLHDYTIEIVIQHEINNTLENVQKYILDSDFEVLGMTIYDMDIKTILINPSEEVWQNFGNEDNSILSVMYISEKSITRPNNILVMRNGFTHTEWETFDNLPEWAKLEQ